MNRFCILAIRDVLVLKTGIKESEIVRFDFWPWRPPVKIVERLMETENPLQSYKDWILSVSEDREAVVFDEYDQYPIGKEFFNAGKKFISKLEDWIETKISQGYDITINDIKVRE